MKTKFAKLKKIFMKPVWFFMKMISNSNAVSINRCLAFYCLVMATYFSFTKYSIEIIYAWFGMVCILLGLKAIEKISLNEQLPK